MSAYVACLGMGLAEMVAQIGIKKSDPESKPAIRKAIRLLQKTRKDALEVVDLDPRVYRAVLRSYKRARRMTDVGKKDRLIDEALENSFRLQADLALLVSLAKKGAESLQGIIPGSIQNDLKISLELLKSAFQGACETARINGVYLKDPEKKSRAERALEELRTRFDHG